MIRARRQGPGRGKTETIRVDAGGKKHDVWLRRPGKIDPLAALSLTVLVAPKPDAALRRAVETRADSDGALFAIVPDDSLVKSATDAICERFAVDPEHLFRAESPEGHSARRKIAVATAKVVVTLSVVCENLRSSRGQLSGLVFSSADGFPDDPARAVASFVVPVNETLSARAEIPDLAPGIYAVVTLHDENGDGKLDTSFGFPIEGYGASLDPKPRMGAPKFDECKFLITAAGPRRTLAIKTIYL